MTVPLLSAMLRVIFATELGFEPSHAMPVNCTVPKFAKADCRPLTFGDSSIHSAEVAGPL